MKLRDLFEIVRTSELDDAVEPFLWSDAELMEYANDAENEACRRGRLLFDSTTPEVSQIAVVANTANYALDARVIFVRRVKLTSRTLPLARFSYRDLDEQIPGWDAHEGTVSAFIPDLDTGILRLYRKPISADTLNLSVIRLPLEPMTNLDSQPEIHARYQRNLRHWIRYRAYSKTDAETNDDKKAAEALALFEQEFGKASTAIDEEWIERQQGYDRWDGTF